MRRLLILLLLLTPTIAFAQAGMSTISSTSGVGGGTGVPDTCSFVTMNSCVDATFERVLTGTAGRISVTDGGAGNAATLDLVVTGVTPGTYGDGTNCFQGTVDAYGRLTNATTVACAGGGGGGAPTTVEYWVSTLDSGLSAEKVPVGGLGLALNLATATFDVNVANGLQIASDNVEINPAAAGAGLTFTSGVFDIVSANAGITVGANSITYVADNGLSLGIASGACATPGLFFTSDTGDNTGFVRSAEDEISFSTNGTCRFKLTTTAFAPVTDNAVDIGTSSLAPRDVYVARDMIIAGRATPSADLVFQERDSDNGTNKITFKAPDSLTADQTYIWPAAGGSDGYLLQLTNAATGQMTWVAGGGCSADAPVGASYLTLALDGTLTSERNASGIAGSGLTSTDGGTNGTFVMDVGAGTGISVTSNAVAVDTTANLTWTGSETFGGEFNITGNIEDWTPTTLAAVSADGDIRFSTDSSTPYTSRKTSTDQMPYTTNWNTPQDLFSDRRVWWATIQDFNSACLVGVGHGNITCSGNATSVSGWATGIRSVKFTTTTTDANAAGIQGSTLTEFNAKPQVCVNFKSGSTTESESQGVFVGIGESGFNNPDDPPMTPTANTSGRWIGFSRDEDINSGRWMYGACNLTNCDFDDTGISYSVDTVYRLCVDYSDYSSNVYYFINGTKLSKSDTLPSGGSSIGVEVKVLCRNGGSACANTQAVYTTGFKGECNQ